MTGQVQAPGDLGNPKAAFARMDYNAMKRMPMDTLHRIMAVSLNASKSVDTDIVVGLRLTDIRKSDRTQPDRHMLNVRKGILEVDPPSSSSSVFMINTDSLTWKKLVLAKLEPAAAVANGKVVISGGTPESFYAFMDLFE
jgi:alkyl sulfatase BDS1-like metallo-beta-lactamase superfamily hydrolase